MLLARFLGLINVNAPALGKAKSQFKHLSFVERLIPASQDTQSGQEKNIL